MKKILIVEDDKLNQLVYKGILSSLYDLRICGNDKEFYIALTENSYDLVIMDLSLNCEKDGIDLIKELREMDEYKITPIIVVSAFAFEKDKINAIASGANSYLAKPFDKTTLIEELIKYLS